MQNLLLDILTRVKANLPYLSNVGVVEDFLLPPESWEPPFVCLKDGGLLSPSMPSQKDIETLIVQIAVYQSLRTGEPGAAILGATAQFGDQGKGVLDIHEDLRAQLNDHLFSYRFSFAHREQLAASQLMARDGVLLTMQVATYHYRRLR